jgi:phosphoenolpyruvate carboxykinase (ATP)
LRIEDFMGSQNTDAFKASVARLLAGSIGEETPESTAEYWKTSRSEKFSALNDLDIHKQEVFRNAAVPEYIEQALRTEPGSFLTDTGALACRSGAKTGRSPKDKRVVEEPGSVEDVWWGPVNIKLQEKSFLINRERAIDYLKTRDRVFVVDAYAGWDPRFRIKIRTICARAYHALYIRNMLIRPTDEELENYGEPDFTIYNAGQFPANRYTEGMTSPCSVDLHLARGEMVILGTQYAGEMKKGVLTLMMYHMPKQGQLCLHSSANEDPKTGSVTVFFGLSGTGKTTLSADPERLLIGDDEHVWTDTGVFNVEGGCYAKCINLSEAGEPEIYRAIRFGAVLENIVFDPLTRQPDYTNISITENTRCAYPLEYIPNAKIPAVTTTHPTNVILLTCDGFGVLPPVSKLTREQVIYHFIQGYTSKMAGTEVGIAQTTAAFSSCYGEPFLVWKPIKYAEMLADKLDKHSANAWLVNTGWVGGRCGGGGNRCPLKYTRAIIDAIHSGELAKAEFDEEPVFHLNFPKACSNVPSELLNPSMSWKDTAAFKATQKELATMFNANFEKKYATMVEEKIKAQGPTVA